ncbi:MAG: Uma2 family endonuclease [Gemmatimonadota bacterium]
MAMRKSGGFWSREEVLALPEDGNRYELIDGELLVSPSPRGRHQIAVWELARLVDDYVRRYRVGRTGMAPADLDLGSRQVSQPDLFVSRAIDGRRPVEWDEYGIPILIAEVLSPSTERYDRIVKRARYQASGVAVYWIVDVEARLVETWGLGADSPLVQHHTLEWRPDPVLAPLVIDLRAYFDAAWAA